MRAVLRVLALPALTDSMENTFRASSTLRVPLALLARPVKGNVSGDREHCVLTFTRLTFAVKAASILEESGLFRSLVKIAAARQA